MPRYIRLTILLTSHTPVLPTDVATFIICDVYPNLISQIWNCWTTCVYVWPCNVGKWL